MRLDPLAGRQPVQLVAATVVGADEQGQTRYVRGDGSVGGPARYLRPAAPGPADDGDGPHSHPRPAPPADGTPCLVIVLAGDLDGAWVIPFT